ncbi:VOC family protein [Roseovarius rhodophyticola]|uniref:VOC family protein n=1 Tax=Roseovarius rhodophyticola TaxID=3080827 RepID=A0ABZ2TF63_9RHOB|nr:VOC family protein [Roseovarius sp. W115]MDV2930799.1 VOC family protein [Roseovarius sp. W115]
MTQGINHLGLAVRDLDASVAFFTDVLGWSESGRDDSYPRSAVSDGTSRLTLWQVAQDPPPRAFDRRQNIGLHHLALEVATRAELDEMHARIRAYPGATVEFAPEPMGQGPRHHMMFAEPGGIRLELVWPGE